ncbi:hypothetical protein LS684_10355 [Cytobacillus spongiae]|jgi:NOL1/NOP2/fmu family ribosome biogenesis protein|uniref:hypothetical protein n=1 Tax=Cytobacillus spongiae TaxID=2901381 RepID=UPI001F3B3F93|nr:hypothetical protein [Cytobacillus spongiae]UII54111.1 hypothetical protein LS684_10355 [Cytobacillus spongiae]
MPFRYYVYTFVFTLIFTLLLEAFHPIQEPYQFFLVLIIVLPIVLFPLFNTLLWTKKVEKVETYLLKNKNKPQYALYYGLANKMDDLVDESIEKLLKKYKYEGYQALYHVIHAFYYEDMDQATTYINKIKQKKFRFYYQAGILIHEGHLKEAEELIEEMKSPWMKHALRSQIEKKKGNDEQAGLEAQQAISHSKGIQRYVLVRTFAREFPSL